MLFFALELDVGKYSPSTSGVLLYVSRLAVRVLGYLDFICECAQVWFMTFVPLGLPSNKRALTSFVPQFRSNLRNPPGISFASALGA